MIRKILRKAALCIPPIGRLYDDRNRLRQELLEIRTRSPSRYYPYFYLGNRNALVFTSKGRPIFVHTQTFDLCLKLISEGQWEPSTESVIRRHLRPGDTVVEIGCNHGHHSLAICEEIGPRGKLYGFEANPEIFPLLRKTLTYNDFHHRAELFNLAIGNQRGQVPFCFDRRDFSGGWVGQTEDREHVNSTVPMSRLDDVLAHVSHINMLRMDIEGSEGNAIKGGIDLIKRSPNLTIISEWNPGYLLRAGSDPEEIAELLSSIGFRASRINGDASLRLFQPRSCQSYSTATCFSKKVRKGTFAKPILAAS